MVYSKRRWFFVSSILSLVTCMGAYYWAFYVPPKIDTNVPTNHANTHKHGKHKHDDNAPVAVSVETSRQSSFPVYLNALGTVTPLRSVVVRPRVSGEIVSITFSEGQYVKEGDMLAQIDPQPLQIQLQQVQGQLVRDEALLENAKIDYIRYQTLLAQDSIAAQQATTQAAQVKQYQGIVEMDHAQVNNAKLQLSYAKITAPISGRLGLRQIDQGNLVQANETTLVMLTQSHPISVVFTLPEDHVPAVMQHQKSATPIAVYAYDRAGKIKLAEGKLVAIDNQIDTSTGTFKLKAHFDNTEENLFTNQFVNIKMYVNTLDDAVQISTAALEYDEKGAFIYVVTHDDTVQLRHVTLGEIQDDKVIILDNLAANEMVVVEGRELLHEGSKITIIQKRGDATVPILNDLTRGNEKTVTP